MRLCAAALMLALLGGPGCLPSAPQSRPASSGRTASSPTETASAARLSPLPQSVWVLSPIGLNLRQTPDPGGERVTTLPRGLQLDVLDSQLVRGVRWFKVRTHDADASQGWVLDRDDLLTETAVQPYYDPNGYSLLYPSDWTASSNGPSTTVLKGPAGSESLTVEYEDDPSKLMPAPSGPGHAVREEGPIEVFGKTVFITVYKLNAPGYQFEVRFKSSDTRAYLFLGSSAGTDTKLYKQMLASVLLSA